MRVRGPSVIAGALLAIVAGAACEHRQRTADAGARHSVVAQGNAASTDPAALLAFGDSQYLRAAYDSAQSAYQRAAENAGAQRDSATVARALTNLGLVAWRQGRFDEAKSIGERALAVKLRLGLKDDLAKSFNALGLLAEDRGDLDESRQRLTEALASAEAVRDSGYIAKIRGNLGRTFNELGDFDRARTEMLAQRDLAARLGDARTEANAINNLGMLETRVGDPTAAIKWLSVSRASYAKMQYAVGEENSLGQFAVAYSQLGQPGRALAYYDSALAVATKHGLLEPEADDVELMAELYESAGNHARALDLLRLARAVSESLGMQEKLGHVALAEAHAYASLGNQLLARERAREAAKRQDDAGARADGLSAELYVAELAQRASDTAEARAALGKARGTADGIGAGWARIEFALGAARVADLARNPRGVLDALATSLPDTLLLTADERAEAEALRARAYARLRQFELAVIAGRQAVSSMERIRQNLNPGALRSSYTAERVDAYADLVVALLTLGRVDEAFQVADHARGRGLVDQLGTAIQSVDRTGSGREIAAADSLLRRIDVLIQRLRVADSIRTPRPIRSPDAESGRLARELSEARRAYEAVLDRMPVAAPSTAILGFGPRSVTTVRGSLGSGEALLEYLSTDDRLLVFVLTRDRIRYLEIPIGSAELAERVHLARDLIATRGNSAEPALRELHERLIAPAERQGLLAGIRKLVLVPHGALSYLPFAALRSPDVGGKARYLVEQYSILTVGSASALSVLRSRKLVPIGSVAAVLAPLPRDLPSTRDEADAVVREIGGARLSLGRDATEATARAALLGSRIVHIASHGTLDADSPMFSSVELAAPRPAGVRTDDDGRLETHEVLGLDIRSRLVFLSGCETALGSSWSTSYSRRDDYATLAQAFLFAGADNVVATLWRIDDRAAAELATRFYAGLAASSPFDALAAAQRSLIRSGTYGAPYYWAAYTVSGSGRFE